MSSNTFGTNFRVTTFGESHGVALGCVIDGVPAGIKIDFDAVEADLKARRPGTSSVTTLRKEFDRPEYLSGILNGVTLGTPIAIIFRNQDAHSSDYEKLSHYYRPGHADYTWQKKFGIRDVRGGGRSSGRETVARVAAGAIAKQILRIYKTRVLAYTQSIGGIEAKQFDFAECTNNVLHCPDSNAAERMLKAIQDASAAHDSIGGVIACRISGVPVGLGEPVFDKLDALLAHAIISIGGVKGIEFGSGFNSAELRGSENNDALLPDGKFATNHAGGILGGISNGDDIFFRCAVKPTPSILQEQTTVNDLNEPCSICITGRHDPCLVPRMLSVVEAMTAIVLADFLLSPLRNVFCEKFSTWNN